ncbi:MAG: hypothetical protein ACOYON_03960 [Fimbriimonas sp.]
MFKGERRRVRRLLTLSNPNAKHTKKEKVGPKDADKIMRLVQG